MESRENGNDNKVTEGTESELENVDAVCTGYRGCVHASWVKVRDGSSVFGKERRGTDYV